MRLSMLIAITALLGGIALAQRKKVEPGETVILKAGQSAEVDSAVALPEGCKDWNITEVPGHSGSLYICKDGKWTEYVRKDKVPELCAEQDTEVTPPKPEPNAPKPK